MIATWDMAFKNLVKRGVYRSRAQAIRKMLYPALLRELKRLRFNPEIKIEPIIERKKVIKKPSLSKRFSGSEAQAIPRNLGYRKPKRKKEKKPSVPRRRALKRSGINQRKRKAIKIKYAIPKFTEPAPQH
jgi:Arc/MetJ-type ribon-helix-helix transcriptional regulator